MCNKGISKAVAILTMASLLQTVSTAVDYIIPEYSSQVVDSAFTLQHYLDNPENVTSHTILYFLPGRCYLKRNFVVQNVSNFTIRGNRSILICNSSSLGITVSNVKSLMINNIEIKQCGKAYDVQVDLHKHKMDNMPFHWRGALYINHSTRVVIHNVSITISAGVSGMIAINNKADFTIVNFSVTVMCEQSNFRTSGIIFYNDDYNNSAKVNYEATNISYKTKSGLFNNLIVLVILMLQQKYSITFNVYNTTFSNLQNSSLMYYHGESCGIDSNNTVTFKHCKMDYNHGNLNLNMFHILINSEDYIFLHGHDRDRKQCNRQNIICFRHCGFANNSNMKSLIYAELKNCMTLNTFINISNSYIHNNSNVTFIRSNAQAKAFWQLSLNINIKFTRIHLTHTVVRAA